MGGTLSRKEDELNLDIRFLLKKVLASGTPRIHGQPIFAVFARNEPGAIKSMHEDLEDAKSAVAFGDIIIRYNAVKRIGMEFVESPLEPTKP